MKMQENIYNPCDDCLYGYSKQNQKSSMCKICEFEEYCNLEKQGLLLRLPCKVGDEMWAIRNYRGVKYAQKGIVNEMFFTKEMKLLVVVKNIARGEFGKIVFLTKEEAEEALKRMESEGK